MSLSSLIVQREIATIRQVEEALARQVLYGGDLATNLLEVAPIEEWRIAVTLADSQALSAAPPGALPLPSAELLALIPAEVATLRGLVPLSYSAPKLVVAASEPLSRIELEQLTSSTHAEIEVRVALYVRVREALAAAYGAALDRRIERLLAKLAKYAEANPPPATEAPRVASQPPASVPPFRLSPAYGVPATRSPLAPQNREETPAVPAARTTQAGFPAPAPTEPRFAESDAAPLPVSVPMPHVQHTGEYPETKPTFVKATSNAVRPVRRHRGPLTADIAEEELKEAVDREALFDLLFDFARQFFDYTALFIAHGDIAEGRDAFGDGAARERVVGIGVPLDMPSMFQTVRETKEPLQLRPVGEGIDAVLLSDLKRPIGVEVLILPVLVRGRAVAILYADAMNELDRGAVAEVSAFAKAVGQGFERLIVRKKLAGFAGGAPATAVGKVDTTALPMPEKGASFGAPNDKIVRAAALGRALFSPSAAPERPGAFRPPSAPPASAPPASAPPATAWTRTPTETPQARGSIPPVLVPPEHPQPAPAPTPTPAPLRAHPSSRPPPAQVAAVHRVSNPPIPREEPDQAAPVEESSETHLESETLDDDAAQALLAEIGESPTPLAADGEEVLVEVPPPQPPESEQAVAVGPRRPPARRSEANLPSIIVDIAGELSALVERVLSGDQASEGELLRQGASAMAAIMARFPGPLAFSRSTIQEPLPKPSDCGPLLRLIARQRKVALAYVLQEVSSPDVSRRFWATYLLVELPYPEGARLLVPRLFDPDAKVRLVARAAARAMAESAHEALLGEIGRIVREPSTSRTARLGLLEALGDLREAKAVAVLIGHLDDEDAEAATVARRALIAITRQDHALDTRKWLAWWGQNSGRHRIEWLIDALVDETQGIRRAAGEELKSLTHETFGYYDDLPKRERERAQQRFRDWWASEGRARFVRS